MPSFRVTLLVWVGLASLSLALPGRGQNLLVDGDFSSYVGSGTPTTGSPAVATSGGGYVYDQTSGITNNVGVAAGNSGGWTFESGGTASGTTQTGSGIYVVNSTANSWIPGASAGNTNGYVAQLDTISSPTTWKTGNAIYQTVTVTVGQTYYLSFYINSESGAGKANDSGADVIVTNATLLNTAGSSGTVSTASTTNLNAASYGNTNGTQYSVNTTAKATGANSTTWAGYTMSFQATNSTVQIAFADDPISGNSNISLEDLNLSTVPEPRQWALYLLLGAGALILVRKLKPRLSLVPRLA